MVKNTIIQIIEKRCANIGEPITAMQGMIIIKAIEEVLKQKTMDNMELIHSCGPAVSPDENGTPSISDEMYFHPDKKIWYTGDDDGETRVIIKFCPFCGLCLSTLELDNEEVNPQT